MTADAMTFAGVDVAAGRKPVLFAALDEDLNIRACERWSLTEAVACLQEYEGILLAINSSKSSGNFRKAMVPAALKPISSQGPRRWLETDSQQCYLALCDQRLLPRRSIEGRLQRALILHDVRLRIADPMDYFEEITRYRLMQGILPLEHVHGTRELDALMAAYVSWLYFHEPRQIRMMGNRVLPTKDSEE